MKEFLVKKLNKFKNDWPRYVVMVNYLNFLDTLKFIIQLSLFNKDCLDTNQFSSIYYNVFLLS